MKLIRGFDWSNRNRVYVVHEWISWRSWFFVIEYGNKNSDPVWEIGIQVG